MEGSIQLKQIPYSKFLVSFKRYAYTNELDDDLWSEVEHELDLKKPKNTLSYMECLQKSGLLKK